MTRTQRNSNLSIPAAIAAVLAVTAISSATQPIGISIKAGATKAWQAGLPLTKWSTVTLRHGNLITTVPIADWSGTGPDVQLNLYHNSLSTVSGLTTQPASDYNLGKGWTHSYGGQVFTLSESLVRVLEDDGTLKDFAWNASTQTWTPPPGYYDKLVGGQTGWTLTYPDQSTRHFDSDGRLTSVRDASGSTVTVNYTSDPDKRIDYLQDARGRRVTFGVQDGLLTTLTLPWRTGGWTRTFTLTYSGGNLSAVADPMSFTREFLYDTAGRIKDVTDQNGHKSLIAYTKGVPRSVNDPEPFEAQVQKLFYDPEPITPATTFTRQYLDRRGKTWVFVFENLETGNLLNVIDPLLHQHTWTYDSVHQPLTYTSPLGKTWTYTFDAGGNLDSVRDPLGHKWSAAYDPVTNNLLNLTPPLDDQGNGNIAKRVTIAYEDAAHPTLPTTITQPAPLDGGSPVVSLLAYYGPSNHPEWIGLLASVNDPNGVLTTFDYDTYGQPKTYREGLLGAQPETTTIRPVTNSNSTEPGGGAAGGSGSAGGGSGSPNPNNWPTGWGCWRYQRVPLTVESEIGSAWGFPPACAVASELFQSGCPSWTYDNSGRVLEQTTCADNPIDSTAPTVKHVLAYDALDRLTSYQRKSHEPFGAPNFHTRNFGYDPDWALGTYERTGPDGDLTRLETDDAGRPTLLERNGTIVTYIFDDADRLAELRNFGNNTRSIWDYDDAGRLASIKHRKADGTTILDLIYQHTPDGLISQITEFGPTGWSATIQYTFDRINRLIRETRTGSSPYDLEYTYDNGGNRRAKTDWLAGLQTTYFYDIDDPQLFGTNHNRIEKYEVRLLADNSLLETTWYGYLRTTYNSVIRETGWVEQVIRKTEESDDYDRTYLMYDTAGRVWITLRDRWQVSEGQPVNCERLAAREYRYDSGRARYLMRDLDPVTLLPANGYAGTWTDYDGATAYGDYTLNSDESVVTTMRYIPGHWEQGATFSAHHGDQIGTSRVMTDADAGTLRRAVYTAFGELVSEDGTAAARYGYAGAWGYETDIATTAPDFNFLHVGERWYDPSTGRFLQRDPIGIDGGLNTYAYVMNSPADGVDPEGASPFDTELERVYRGIRVAERALTQNIHYIRQQTRQQAIRCITMLQKRRDILLRLKNMWYGAPVLPVVVTPLAPRAPSARDIQNHQRTGNFVIDPPWWQDQGT